MPYADKEKQKEYQRKWHKDYRHKRKAELKVTKAKAEKYDLLFGD